MNPNRTHTENYIAVCSSCYKKNGTRNAPVIKFENGSKYTFYTPGDGGLGTGYKSLIVFDLSILNLTPLPAAAHDSLMFNHIGYEPLEKIMELYMQSGKQIFIAYDKQEAPTPRYKRFSMKRQSSISVRTATNCSATHGPRRQTRKRM